MKIINAKFLYTYFLLIISGLILPCEAFAQSENRLLHPHFFDEYTDYQFLPDGTCRMFAQSDEHPWHSSKHAVYMDIQPGISPDSIEIVDLTLPGHYFNGLLYELFTLRLKEGSTLLANTQVDCDYWPPGGLIMLDKDGQVIWFKDLYEIIGDDKTGGEMVFIESNAILVKNSNIFSHSFIIDRQGEILDMPLPNETYDETIETSYGFIARKNYQLDILDTSFQVLYSYNLDQEIQTIKPVENEHFMIRTDAKFYELDTNLTLKYLPLTADQYSIVWKSTEHFWALSNYLHAVVKLDTFFTPIDTIAFANGVDVKMGFNALDSYVVAEYISQKDRNIIVFKGSGEELQMTLPYDIGITSVTIPDTIWVDPSGAPLWGLWTYRYEFVDVEVTNFGEDTVFKYNIEALDVNDCSFCSGYNRRWEMNMPLPPGASLSVSLGPFFTNCVQSPNTPLCITTTLPNSKADGNYVNDKFCQPINTIILDIDAPTAFVQERFYPNPANDQLNIELLNTNFNTLTGKVFDFTGRLIQRFEFTGEKTSISTINWQAGVYVVKLAGSNGNFITRKLVIQH